MAGDWIKFEHTTPDKPEVVQIAAHLRLDQDAVVGKLLRIWIWADQNSIAGSAVPVTEAFIDRLVGRKGFAAAMRRVHWLEGQDGALMFPGFGRHNGSTAKGRAMENRKKANQRASRSDTDSDGTNVPPPSGQTPGTKPGPEKRREDIGVPKGTPSADPAGPGRAREVLFDALAIAEGSDPKQLTKDGARRVAVALAQIKAVCPDLTISEVQRRARVYRTVMPAGSRLTANALAVNWAKCGGGATPQVKPTALPPPPEGWRTMLEEAYPGNLVNKDGKPWSDVPDNIRAEVFGLGEGRAVACA